MIFWQVTALIYKLEQTTHFIQEQKDSLGGYRGSSWLQTSGVKPVPLNSLKYLQLVGLSLAKVDSIQASFLKIIYYFWLCWIFIAAHGLSQAVVNTDCSWWWLRLGRSTGSRYLGLSSGGAQAVAARSMRTPPPRPGVTPTSTPLAGGFPSTAPPGKSYVSFPILYFTHSF